MLAEPPALGIARTAGGVWHLVNRAAATLCGASTPAGGWEIWDTAQTAIAPAARCRVCLERSTWLRAERPVPPHADRLGYSRWLQVQWWLAGGLVFRQEGR